MSEQPPVVAAAPGDLEFVRSFVNTLDVEEQTDLLQAPEGARTWATAHRVLPIDEDELPQTLALRDALREALAANHDRSSALPDHAATALTHAAQGAGVELAFTSGGIVLRRPADAHETVGGRVARTVAAALADGTWQRLKICREDTCQWAFYDHSRSRTGKWCSMGICGNRTKQARWRASVDQPAAPAADAPGRSAAAPTK